MLEVKNLVKSFGPKVAVNNISFKVKPGRIFGLLGRNGAGKSTIFRTILNIIKPDSGDVLYDGKKIDDKVTDIIGYLPEEGSLILQYTVLEQCLYYGALKSMNEDTVKTELVRWLKAFDISHYMNMKIKDLSKGNRQKIQFIIAILHDPKLLILDEPFSGLDPISVEGIKDIILKLRDEGKMIVFSSHRMDHVEMICEDILILDHGDEILKGNLSEIKSSYSKQNVSIVGKIDTDTISKIKGVIQIEDIGVDSYNIKVQDDKTKEDILNCIDKSKLLKFSVLDINLNEIFIDKVGRSYEE